MKTNSNLVWLAVLTLVAFVSYPARLKADPISDIGSSSQQVRDAAAKRLRETYVASSRTNWNDLVAKLKIGISRADVLKVLGQATNHIEGGGGSGVAEMVRYRLDDLWLLDCSYSGSRSESTLSHLDFVQQLRAVWVAPPTNLTGIWTTYYVNGQKSSEGSYKDGRLEGDGIGFHPDGSKSMVHHWVNGVSEGEEAAYYPSGKLKYKGRYHLDSQVGTWTWFNEDGSIKSKSDYDSK